MKSLTKRGSLVLGVCVLVLIIMVAVFGLKSHSASGNTLAGVAQQGVAGIADYRLIPILNTQGTDVKQMYLNSQVTPALFFAPWCKDCQQEIPAIQDKLNKMGTGIHKTLVLVSTFAKTSDQSQAIADAQAFQQQYKITMPLAVQVGPPTEFVKQVPTLVYIDEQGKTQIVTDKKAILDALDKILTMPSQQANPQAKK